MLILAGLWWWQRPSRVVTAAVEKLGAAQTQQFKADLQLANAPAGEALLGQPSEVQLLLQGAFERKADQRDSLTSAVQLITATEGLTLRVEGETRFIGDQAYVRIISSPPTFPVLVQLKDTWLSLPRGADSSASEARLPEQLFTEVDRVGSEKVNDRRATKYSAQATSEAVVQLLDSIADLLGTRLTDEQINNIRQSVAGGSTVPIDIWVSPVSRELIKLAATLTIPGSNTIGFTFEPSARNEPVDISVPENPVSLETALQQ